ncbi:hypothetical protein ZIOFF_061739 [Zingiber officinale]|uniref:Pentatricopeptide repeat-containing protein n=1 Tax=Zingiber officinale TaxID=94328 RepID=A0A8J5KIL3_ZINOF|nr:hypothetical protein ZIOFF_061739 [Zingiber officinale]
MALGIHSAGYCGAARRLYGSSKTRWRIVAAATPDGATEAEIRVCVNRTCGRQGSREILAVFSSICPPGVSVISCGCLGRCGGGPNLAVLPAGALIGHCGTAAKAAQILAEICGPGFDPRRNLEALALSKEAEAALEKGNAAEAESLLSQAIDLQPSGGVHLIYKSRSSVRLTMGDKIGALEDAKRASLLAPNFAQIKSLTASSWNSILRRHSRLAGHCTAFAQFKLMLREGVVPDKHTFPLLLKIVSGHGGIGLDQIHAQIWKFGYTTDSFVRNSLVSAYAKRGRLPIARNLFDEMPTRDPVPWTALMRGCIQESRPSDALELFHEMRCLGVEIDEVVIVSVLKCCGLLGDVWLGMCVHGFYIACGRVKWDLFIGSALVDMYSTCGRCDDARRLFDEMPHRNVVTWSTMVAGYVQCNRPADALCLFRNMLVEGETPNEVTIVSALTSCARTGALVQGRWIHGCLNRSKLETNSFVGTALIDMYSKCGCIDEAVAVFNRLPHKDVYPWTALINGLAIHGCAAECLDLFSRMIKSGVQPNEVTFIGVLSACSHRGLVDQGTYHFDSMLTDYGVEPRMEHYGCMVDLFGRAGLFEEALNLIRRMPLEPSAGVWGALLNACIIHRNYKLGERVGQHLVKLEPDHSGRYALLANLYSLAKKPGSDADLRKAMKGRRLEKMRGSSWIEVDSALREFVATDVTHPESKEIYRTLDEISTVMKLES